MVAMNVNRWRAQLGLAASEQKWAEGKPLDVATAADQAVWVDIVGEGTSPAASMMGGPMMGGAALGGAAMGSAGPAPVNRTSPPSTLPPMPPPIGSTAVGSASEIPPMEPDPRLKFERPDGWRDGRMNSMRMAAFNVGPDDRIAEITVIPAGGDLRGNVARWLGQVRGGAAPNEVVDAAMEAAQKVSVDGRDGQRFFLTGDGQGDGTAIDATIVPMGDGFSLFIKMTGPEATLKEESQRIADFIKSIKLKM
jgi:hypothetical protein